MLLIFFFSQRIVICGFAIFLGAIIGESSCSHLWYHIDHFLSQVAPDTNQGEQ